MNQWGVPFYSVRDLGYFMYDGTETFSNNYAHVDVYRCKPRPPVLLDSQDEGEKS